MDVNTLIRQKPHRTTETRIGDTLFTIVSIESDRAKETLYDKVKRMILYSEASSAYEPPAAARAPYLLS